MFQYPGTTIGPPIQISPDCPRGKALRPGRPIPYGGFFYSKARDCSRCSTASLCLSKGRLNKELVISNEQPALLRARHRRERWSDEDQRLYQRHRWRSERFHGEAKAWRGLARAVRRGLPIENPFGRAGAMDVEPGRRVSL